MFVTFAGRVASFLTEFFHQLSLFPHFMVGTIRSISDPPTYLGHPRSDSAVDFFCDHLFPVLHNGGFRPPVVEFTPFSDRSLRLLSQPLVRQ
jgi:hypothetical protein